MSFVTAFYVLGHEDFHYKRLFVERLTLLIQERYEQTFSHPAWQVRKGLYRNCYLSNISCCWNSGSCPLHNKCIILVEHSAHFYGKRISVHQSTQSWRWIFQWSRLFVSTHDMDA